MIEASREGDGVLSRGREVVASLVSALEPVAVSWNFFFFFDSEPPSATPTSKGGGSRQGDLTGDSIFSAGSAFIKSISLSEPSVSQPPASLQVYIFPTTSSPPYNPRTIWSITSILISVTFFISHLLNHFLGNITCDVQGVESIYLRSV